MLGLKMLVGPRWREFHCLAAPRFHGQFNVACRDGLLFRPSNIVLAPGRRSRIGDEQKFWENVGFSMIFWILTIVFDIRPSVC